MKEEGMEIFIKYIFKQSFATSVGSIVNLCYNGYENKSCSEKETAL
jgi:hypothetical protein